MILYLILSYYFYSPTSLLAKNSSYEEAYYYFLLSQALSKNYEEMEENLKKAIEKDKKSLFLKKMLLSVYLQTQNFKEAEKLGESLYTKIPEDRELVFFIK